jgi:hypothetical protein
MTAALPCPRPLRQRRGETRLSRGLPCPFAKPCRLPIYGVRVTLPYLAYTRPHDDAAQLLAAFGSTAAAEAAARAERSRRVGNHLHFCRWRQVERLLALLGSPHATGTIH